MDSKSMTRKDFFVLTFSLVGSAVVASNCGSSNGGGGGTGGSATGTGGKGTGGSTTGTGGATGTGGRADGGGDTGPGDTGPGDVPVMQDSGPAEVGSNCTLPLATQQQVIVAGTGGDTNNHFHTVTVNATILNSTTDQTFDTGTGGGNNHTHMVTLTATELGTLRGGGTVTIRSTNFGASDAGAGAAGHTHSYLVSCFPIPDGGTDSGPG